MTQIWFIPLGVLVGVMGTRTSLGSRPSLKTSKRDKGWWVLLVLSWLPLLFWLLSQFVTQY